MTAGSHTLFFSASTEAGADKWIESIQDAWNHCTMNVLRCVQASKTSVEQTQSSEQMLAAMNASLRFEQRHLFTELQQVEGTVSALLLSSVPSIALLQLAAWCSAAAHLTSCTRRHCPLL